MPSAFDNCQQTLLAGAKCLVGSLAVRKIAHDAGEEMPANTDVAQSQPGLQQRQLTPFFP